MLVSSFLFLAGFEKPVSNPETQVFAITLSDLSADKDFVSSVEQVFSIQTNTDMAGVENSFKKVYASLLAVTKNHTAMNDQAMINESIDKLVKQGRITNANFVCLRALYNATVACARNSSSYAAFFACVREAYAQFVICVHANDGD